MGDLYNSAPVRSSDVLTAHRPFDLVRCYAICSESIPDFPLPLLHIDRWPQRSPRYGHGTTLPASLCDGRCIELMAGRAAERMLLSDSEPVPPVDDLRQARELAMLICTSEEAIETFIAHCDVAAWDLLLPYGDVVMTLSIVLRIKRTLDGAEFDKIISDVQAQKALAVERGRRKRWQRVIENAAAFDHG